MCGRYASSLAPEAIARLFHTTNPLANTPPSWNIAPGRNALIVRRESASGERHLVSMRWGFVPPWMQEPARSHINARAETVATTPFFRAAFAERRCLVPADAFYEWSSAGSVKRPYAIARRDGRPMALAGIWERVAKGKEEALGWASCFAIITTPATGVLAGIHNRMPAILEEDDWPLWLGEENGDAGALLRPAAENLLRVWEVSRRVNSVANDGPELLAAIGEARLSA